MEANTYRYPLQLAGELSPGLGRGLWLVKRLLAIPHYIALFFLWIAFAVVSVIAFFAILFTGRYPFRLDLGGDEPPTAVIADAVSPMPAPVAS